MTLLFYFKDIHEDDIIDALTALVGDLDLLGNSISPIEIRNVYIDTSHQRQRLMSYEHFYKWLKMISYVVYSGGEESNTFQVLLSRVYK